MTGSTTITHARRYAEGHAAGNETSALGSPQNFLVIRRIGFTLSSARCLRTRQRDLGSMAVDRYSKETPHVEGKSCGL
jgi:hypothetical protein